MQTTISKFWWYWMLVSAASMIVMGLVMTFSTLVTNLVDPIYYNNYFDYDAYSRLSAAVLSFHRFLYGVTGAVMSSWSILIFFLVMFPLRKGQRWAWFAISSSLIVWFIADGYASISTGFAIHALLNMSLLVMMGIPLLASYRQTS